MPRQTDTPPVSGWLTDLTEMQKQNLAGALVDVFSGARATRGLVMDIENNHVRIFRDDQPEPIKFPVNSTSYQRVPGTPMRPALARALVYQRAWDEQAATLNGHDYDRRRGEWEEGVPEIYDKLLAEYRYLAMNPTVPVPGGRA